MSENTLPIPTPHINAPKDGFAKTVLMPGDPKRAKYIADTFLKNAVLVNDVRGIQGYTGEYKGKKISVMASGMGIPSIGIYSYELYHGYGVENIIRVGTAGALLPDIKIRDILVATGACTDSNYANHYGLKGTISAVPSFELMKKADETMRRLGFQDKVRFGQLFSTDVFYKDKPDALDWVKMGVIGIEMEAYALFLNAARAGKKALAICAVSDNLISKQELSAEERSKTVDDMLTYALETAISFD
jgi:purine-nucleoside phosphorylase